MPFDVPLSALMALAAVGAAPQPGEESPATLVAVAPVRQARVASGREFVGTAVPSKLAVVGSAVDGRVETFSAEVGSRVASGGPLAHILTGTIELERDAAAAQLLLAERELDELRNGARPEELRQAKARAASADATRKYLATRRKRVELLFERNSAMTRDDLDEAAAAEIEAEQNYQEALAAYELAVAGPRPERIAQAEARGALQQATLDKLEDQIKKYDVRSYFDGYVVEEHTEAGEWVKSGDPVATIAALDTVEVEAFVLEQYVSHVRPGASARVAVPSLSEEAVVGTVISVSPQGDARSRTFAVRIEVPGNVTEEDGPRIRAGMLTRVTLPTGPETDALLIPKDALVLGGERPVVWAVARDGVTADGPQRRGEARAVPVRLGVAEGDEIQALGELTADDLVVVRGNERILAPRDGNPVVRWTPRSAEPAR